jgi:predicted DNA-binding protein (UPF0251 family)
MALRNRGYPASMRGGAPTRIELPVGEIVRLYCKEGISSTRIATQFGVSDSTIQRRLREAGVQIPDDRLQRRQEILEEKERRERARNLGLDDNATWREIHHYDDQNERIAVATALGWKEDLEFTDEIKRVGWDPYPTWRNILTILLDLPEDAPTEYIVEKIRNRS